MDLGLDVSAPLVGLSVADATPTATAPSAPSSGPGAALARDMLLLGGVFVALIAWDALGLDLPISRWFGDAAGFPWRDQWLVSDVLHSGARYAAWALALVLAAGIWRPLPFARGLARDERIAWVVATIGCALLIPLLKLASLTSCPWSLAEFGGTATHVSHWAFGQADGGPGRCFPAGHATAAFCFLPGWTVLRRSAPRAARRWLVATVVAGAVLTMVQVVRGAHYVSHSLWTGWCCAVLGVVLVHAVRGLGPARTRIRGPSPRRRPPLEPTATPRRPASPGAPLAGGLRRAWSAPRSPQAIVLVLAAWLVLSANLTLWRSVLAIESGPRGWLICLGVAVLLFAALSALLALTAWGRAMKPVWLSLLVAAAVSQYFMLGYGAVIDTTMMANVFETNVGEARDLLRWGLLANLLLVAGVPALWLVRLPVQRVAPTRAVLRVVVLFGASLVVALAATTALYSVLAPMVRNHMGLRYLPNPIVPVWSTVRVATRPLSNRPKPLVTITAGAALGPSHAAASAKPPLLVLVVGETARADHFALNGYPRDTTPELAARGVLSFRNAWSCGTNTLASVPCMFSSLGKAQFEARKAEHENLLDVVQAAGMAVLWLDNQAGCKSICARVPSASTGDLAGTPAGAKWCADGECLDEALLEGLDARIAALPEAKRARGVLLVMHQMGSHGPAYGRRSTEAYKRFRPECRTTTLGDCAPAELVNVYDNSIAYTDHVLARTIDWAKAQARYAPALLYVSDHGESLGEYGVFLHGVPYAFAPDAQKHVAMVAWLDPAAAARARLDMACMRGRLDEKRTHDNLYHSVLGLLDVTTPTYDGRLDIWSACERRDQG